MRILLTTVTLSVLFVSCKDDENKASNPVSVEETRIFNAADSLDRAAYSALNLDDTYANLLDPEVSKDSIESVFNAWMKMHQSIGTRLDGAGFDWESPDTMIQVLHKVYFEPDGTISYYFFKIDNESVSEVTRTQFAMALDSFAQKNRFNLPLKGKYAQCGKTSYVNRNPG